MRMRRTDLALEARELWQEQAGAVTALPGVEARDSLREGIPVNTVKVLDQRGEQPGWEGCLSLPGMWGNVMRPDWVKIRAQDRNGQWFEMEGTDMTARCFCHEISHLDGHMYTELTERLYTAEELDEILAQEGEQANHPKRERRGRRRR